MKNLIKKELCSGMWKNLRPEVKRVYALIIAAILVCGIAVTLSISLTSCEEAKAQNEESAQKVESTGSVPVILYMFYLSMKDMESRGQVA